MAEATAAAAGGGGGVGGLLAQAPGTAATTAAAAAAAVAAAASATDASTQAVTLTPVTVTPGVSVCGHLVTPLFGGAGNSILFLTQDLAQLMKNKFGATWPAVQIHCDTLQTREMRYVAGGLLASVVTLILWKCYKRYKFSKAKRPPRPDPRAAVDARQWHQEGVGNEPCRQARVDAVSAPHRHACRPEAVAAAALLPESQQPGGLASFLPWDTEELDGQDDDRATSKEAKEAAEQEGGGREVDRIRRECTCPQPACGSPALVTPPLPPSRGTSPRRLLYSVKESRVVRRAVDLSDPQLASLLSYASCPSFLPPSVITPTSSHCPTSRAEGLMTAVPILSCSPQRHTPPAPAAFFPAGQRTSPHSNVDSRRADSSDGSRRQQPGRTGVEGEEKEKLQQVGSPCHRQPYPSYHAAPSNNVTFSCPCGIPTTPQCDHPASPYQIHHAHVRCSTQPILYQTPQGPVYMATHNHCTNSCNTVQGVPYNQNAACPTDQASQTEDSGQSLPVVQQPSDTTLSVTGSELDRPQQGNSNNDDGAAGQREKANKTELVPRHPGEIVPNEGTLMTQTQAYAGKYPPFHPAMAGFGPDFAQGDLPWVGLPNSDQAYPPKPFYSYGNYNPNEHYPFQPPSWLSPPGGYFMPSVPMMYPSQGMFMPPTVYPGNFHPHHFMYPQPYMPDGARPTKQQAPGGMGASFRPDFPLHQGNFMVPRMPQPQPPHVQPRTKETSSCRLKQPRSQAQEARGRARRQNLAEAAEGMERQRLAHGASRDAPRQAIPLSGVVEEGGYPGIVTSPSPALSDVLRVEGAASAEETVSISADGAACPVEHSESYYVNRSSSGGQAQFEELRYTETYNTHANDSPSVRVDGVVSNESLVDALTAFHRLAPSDGMETQL